MSNQSNIWGYPSITGYKNCYSQEDNFKDFTCKEIYDYSKDRIFFAKKRNNVFSSGELKNLYKELENLKPNFLFKKRVETYAYLPFASRAMPIQFYNGKIKIEDLAVFNYYDTTSPTIHKSMQISLQRFGKDHQIGDKVIHASFTILKYVFSKNNPDLFPINWHQDSIIMPDVIGTCELTDYTRITLITDPEDDEKGWEGGEFLLAQRRELKKTAELAAIVDKTAVAFMNDPKSPIYEYQLKYGESVEFANVGWNHVIRPFVSKGNLAERIIFSLTVVMPK